MKPPDDFNRRPANPIPDGVGAQLPGERRPRVVLHPVDERAGGLGEFEHTLRLIVAGLGVLGHRHEKVAPLAAQVGPADRVYRALQGVAHSVAEPGRREGQHGVHPAAERLVEWELSVIVIRVQSVTLGGLLPQSR